MAHPLTSTESPRTSFELAKCARVSIVKIYLHPARTYFIPTCEMGEVAMTMMDVCFLSIVAQSIQKPEQFTSRAREKWVGFTSSLRGSLSTMIIR